VLDLRNLDHRYIWSMRAIHRCLVAEIICSWEARACKLTEISIGQRDATYTVSISSFPIPAFRPKQGWRSGNEAIMRPPVGLVVTGKPLVVSFLHLKILWSFFWDKGLGMSYNETTIFKHLWVSWSAIIPWTSAPNKEDMEGEGKEELHWQVVVLSLLSPPWRSDIDTEMWGEEKEEWH